MGLFSRSENRPINDNVFLYNKCTSSIWPITLFVLVIVIHVSAVQMVSAEDICGGTRNRFVCDKQNPALFHICLGSNKYTMVCPGSLHFNIKTQKCDWPGTVTCIPESSPVPSASPYVSKISRGREHNSSIPTRMEDTNVITGLQKITNDRPESNPQTSEVNYVKPGKLKLSNPGYDFKKSSKKRHANKHTRSEGVYVNKSKLDAASKSFEPYIASHHLELSPTGNMAFKRKVTGSRSDKYGRLQAENNSMTNKVQINTATTTKVKDSHPGSTAKSHDDQSYWQSNRISKTSKAHQKAQSSVDTNSKNPYTTMSELNMAVTSKARVLHSGKSRAAYLHRSAQPANRKFRPRVSQQNQKPQKYSARISPFRKSPWNSLSRNSQHPANNKATNGHNTKSNDHSIIVSSNTAAQMHTTKQTLRPTNRPDTTKKIKGISLGKTPWWNTPRSETGSTTALTINNSPRKYFQKWHNTIDSDDLKDSSATSYFKTKTEPKVAKRQQKRKYKPRNYVAKPSYNTRTPLGNGHGQVNAKPTSLNYPASQFHQKPAKSPASADGKVPWNTVNAAAASSDIKAAAYQSNDLIETIKSEPASENMIVQSLTEDASKETKVAVHESPIEKYSAKRGKCSSAWCKLPACRCVGSDIPGDLEVNEVPQMVMLTFDDSVNIQNVNFYKELFNGTLKNPNGCPIKSTFFVSGDNSDYQMVKKLSKQGHEIASHTLSHRSPTTWWADAGFENWENEVVGMKNQLNEKAGVRLKEVSGMRAPFLQVGGDGQYAMLKEHKFRYDSSMVTGYLYSNNQPPIWPFTLDTPPDSTTCNISPCPTRSYPGVWEVPLVRWYGTNHIACAMPDACTIDSGRKNVHKFMDQNFNRHYKTNRAPFGIFIHAAWFSRTEGVFEGLKEFLRSLTDKEDVWVVTVSQALDWIEHPVRLSALNAIESWAC